MSTVNPFDIEKVLRQELSPGERLLWSGTPRQGLLLRGSDVLAVPFSLLWGGFAFFWEYSVIHSAKGAPLFFMLWGIPFVLMGVYIIAGRFFVDAYQRSRTYYGLTSERVLIIDGIFSRALKSLDLRGLHDVSLSERNDQSGTITFGPNSPMASMWRGTSWPGMSKQLAPAFDMIANARRVYGQIRDAQKAVGS